MSLLEEEKKVEKRAKAVVNERLKLSATYVNGAAVATFAVGGLTVPLNDLAVGGRSSATTVIAIVCTLISLVLHFVARFVLRGLK